MSTREKLKVLIPTTSGLVEVLLLTEEDPAIGRSVACIGGTTATAGIDADYQAFVARPTGIIERLFGHRCYRLDVSGPIDAGPSWQLGVLIAHSLHAAGRLAQEGEPAEGVIWATGAVRSVDLAVSSVSHLREKLAHSLGRLGQEVKAGRRVVVALPHANAPEVPTDLGIDVDGLEIASVVNVQDLWERLDLKAGEGDLTPRTGTQATARLSTARGLLPIGWHAVATGLGVTAVAAGAVLWTLREAETMVPSTGSESLSAMLEAAVPRMSRGTREREASAFSGSKLHRAMAFAPQAQRTWATLGWSSQELAQEKVLEKCQQTYDEPCALVASDDIVVTPGADGRWPVRDSPRVRYNGIFNPDRIPSINKLVEQRIDVAGYLTAPSPKAAALHAVGVMHVATGAPSQRQSEEQVLRACNQDAAVKRSRGPCHLYSIENRVVLALRATGPITSEAPSALSPAALRDSLVGIMAQLAPDYSLVERQVQQYIEAPSHKALAVFPPSGAWRVRGAETPLAAEERVLEACHVRHGGPCVLVSVNNVIHASGAQPVPRPMSRVAHDGAFEPSRIPGSSASLRRRPDVVAYRAAQGPKAAAYHPWGELFIVTGASSQHLAEMQAIADCNRNPNRGGKDGPCLLYAVGDTVVLPKRSHAPITP